MIIFNVFGHSYEKTFNRKSDGKSFTMRFQEAEILRGDRRPRVVEFSIPEGQAYPEGLYTLSSGSVRPGAFDRLELGFISLEALEDAVETAKIALDTFRKGKKK